MLPWIKVPAALCAAAAIALVAAACGAGSEPPPRRPFDDASPPAATAAPTATSSPRPPGDASAVNGGAGVDTEGASAAAIEAMAEWLGVPARQLSVVSVEAVTWTSACLGVARPGVACAEVETPGYRVVLLDAFDGRHSVHADQRGNALWPGEALARGTLSAVDADGDADGDAVTLDTPQGARTFRVAPGSTLAVASAGDAVVIAYDPAPGGGAPPVIAWLSVEEANR